MPKSSHHHICRVDRESRGAHGWSVQVQHNGQIVRRYFSDSVHGGKRKALQVAIACRDALLEQLWHGRYTLWRRQCKRRNNTSGIVGIARYIAREMVGDKEVERISWHAFWNSADGKQRSRKFSVNKYGETRAKTLACAARRQALAVLQH
jgi:AP2 domain